MRVGVVRRIGDRSPIVYRGALLPPCDDHEVAANLQDHVGLASA
jgi:hypothetical protein